MTAPDNTSYARITLKPGRERSVMRGNPWVFSGAVARVEGADVPGRLCDIHGADGAFLARGYVNPESRIVCRVLAGEPVAISRDFIIRRIETALRLRDGILDAGTTACRLVNSEGDFLPGLIVDRYGDGIVVQILTAGMERLREMVIPALEELLRPSFIVERSDSASRKDEGLAEASGILVGTVGERVTFRESGFVFTADLLHGQKTGFYLDQRESRRLVGGYCRDAQVLNLFAYTGGFSVYAAAGGASAVTSVESSGPALELARENVAANGFGSLAGDCLQTDVFTFLNEAGRPWDVIVLDPPAFAARKHSVDRAARGYKDINLRALRMLAPGGILATYSCSHHISAVLFRQIVYAAAMDAGREVQVLHQSGHPADHPFNLCHIEGEYLKGLVVRAVS